MAYLDAAATTPVRREALEAMWPFLTADFGNPSSSHGLGQRSAEALDAARKQLAAVLGCRAGETVFTSGGTEAANLAIKGLALANPRGKHLITAATEHEAVLESCDYLVRLHGFRLTVLPVDATGLVRAAELEQALERAASADEGTALVSIALANNEIGTVQPIRELAEIAHEAGALFHTDAVQAAGWLSLDVAALGIDALTLAGHKLGAPKGVGAAYLRGALPVEPLIHGGGQERGRRSGTENVAGAVGLGTAIALAEAERADAAAVAAARDAFIAAVLRQLPEARLTGHPEQRLPGHASFTLGGVSGESVLLELEQRGVLASSGSACAAGRDEPSHALLALGIDRERAQTALRFTFGHGTTAEQLLPVADALAEAVAAVRG